LIDFCTLQKAAPLVSFNDQRLKQLSSAFEGKRIAIIGDVMVDRYYWGRVTRISPEAPVPIVEVESESARLGGAANVANNIASLGGIPVLIGVVGKDPAGDELRSLLGAAQFEDKGIFEESSRPTTIKTRVIAHSQHVVRIDQETRSDISAETQERILDFLANGIDSFDAIIFEDYNKGVVVRDLIRRVITMARSKHKIVTVDPKFENFFEYQNVTLFKPNRKESEEALGIRLSDTKSIERAGRDLLDRLRANHVLLTLGDRGMALFSDGVPVKFVANKARNVADVSGAGDTVISTLTLAMAAGANVEEAAALANYAAGIVCGEVGIVPINREILYSTILQDRGT